MRSLDQRVARWVGFVCELLEQPLTVFPHASIAAKLSSCFDVVAVSWNWRDQDGTFGFELLPPIDLWIPDEYLTMWCSGELLDRHALVRWLAVTNDPTPQSIQRVPVAITSRQDRALMDEILRPLGCEQQLSIPYRLDGAEHRAFVLARSDDDFSDEDLALGVRLQPLFRALDRQSQVLAEGYGPGPTEEPVGTVGLTGRESAVLRLLADGHTAAGIARRLCISPRTVQKHLEHVYRKLEVTDRLSAVHLATELRLVGQCRLPRQRGSGSHSR